jgi:hypothetical protein
MTGGYGLIAASELIEMPSLGKKQFRRVTETTTIRTVTLKKGTYGIVIDPQLEHEKVRIDTATHDVLVVPKCILKTS